MLLRNYGVTGKHKLKDKWRSMPYIVVGKMPNLPVYQVKPERGTGVVKTVHRNHLLPIGYLVRLPSESDEPELPQRPGTRTQQRRAQSSTQLVNHEDEPLSSESDYEDVDPPRQISIEWKDLLSQPEFCPRQLSQFADEVQVASPARDPAGVDQSLETDDVPDADLPPTTDPDTDRDLEGGADGNGEEVAEEDELPAERSKRAKKPVLRLSYDELGKPSDQPLTVLSHGVLVGSGTYRDVRCRPCQTAWCHPMALCPDCARLSPFSQCKQIQVI